ncbi:hypothetical protein [Flindersiella endophytica]
MSGPNQEDVQVALETLRKASKVWDEQKLVLEAAARRAGDLRLETYQMGLAVGMHQPYQEIQDGLAALLNQAVTEAGSMSMKLWSAQDQYAREEEAGVHKLKDQW